MNNVLKRKVKGVRERTRVISEIDPDRVTKCVQSEREHSDINNIVARAYKTGQLPILKREPIPDLIDQHTYQDMLNKVVFAQQQFERLPSQIRETFDNKPEKMLAALDLKEKPPELVKILEDVGLLEKKIPEPENPPMKVEVVNPSEPSA